MGTALNPKGRTLPKSGSPLRHLVLILGDQLDERSSALENFDPKTDAVWMAEVSEESTHVWTHKARIAMFLSAMRHFRQTLTDMGVTVHYRQLDDKSNKGTFAKELQAAVKKLAPQKLIVTEPGEYRVREALQDVAKDAGVDLEIRTDRHFLCTTEEFARHVEGRKSLRMEFFYREMRKKTGVLMNKGKPVGGEWNYDSKNRDSFGKQGPGSVPAPKRFAPDNITKDVFRLIEKHFPDHPGQLDNFDFPVSAEDAETALRDFIEHRLPNFGKYQDAMWTAEPYLYHSRLSAAMNLKLLDPRTVIKAAEEAYQSGHAPLPAVEGFIRQILGWREYVRGIYWLHMPAYLESNALGASQPLPAFYWTGDTDMACLSDAIGQTMTHGYAHHIQRLMVTGLFALLYGVNPQEVHEWYLAVYVDAVEWVELPNTVGMSQFADGGIMASKPYAATGKYIKRMSNYCSGCRYNPDKATGEDACPFTTFYWDFLQRHEEVLKQNQRMSLQVRNLEKKSEQELQAIRQQAEQLRKALKKK